MNDPQGEKEELKTLKYSILLVIKHPSLEPDRITNELRMSPTASWVVGEQRSTPAGRRLSGVNESSFWSLKTEAYGDRFFFEGLGDFLTRLEENSEFVINLAETGGSIAIIIHLSGGFNIGDEMSWGDLDRLARLKVSLGIEVFPSTD